MRPFTYKRLKVWKVYGFLSEKSQNCAGRTVSKRTVLPAVIGGRTMEYRESAIEEDILP